MLTLLLRGSGRVLSVETVRAVNHSYYSQQMGKRVAVVLAGCGVYDGSEIHEASAILVHLSRGGASVSSIWLIFDPQVRHHFEDEVCACSGKRSVSCVYV